MNVQDILNRKGSAVHTVAPDTSVSDLLNRLREHGVGALVVSSDGTTIEGIVSERDVVRGLATDGPALLDSRVLDVCTTTVTTCSTTDSVDELMVLMSEKRIRHLPITDASEQLIGIVSIGDVVKSRLTQLESEAAQLREYVTGSSY